MSGIETFLAYNCRNNRLVSYDSLFYHARLDLHAHVCVSMAHSPRKSGVLGVPKGPFPEGGVLWRGGGFPGKHRGFFTKGKKFRAPAYLATSFKRHTAENFRRNAAHSFRNEPVGDGLDFVMVLRMSSRFVFLFCIFVST